MANAHPNLAKVVENVKQHSLNLAQISEKMDIEAFENALHDDWFTIDAHGKKFTKAEELKLLRSSNFKPSSIKVQDLEVTVNGDMAIVTGVSTVNASFEGKDISGKYRFTQVFKAEGSNLLEHAVGAVPKNMAMMTCINMAVR